MRRTWIGIGTIAAFLVAMIIACDNPTGDDSSGPDGGSSGPSIDGVDDATLSETVGPGDLGSVDGGTPPTDKNEVLNAIISGLGLIGTNVGDFIEMNNSWEPSTGSFTTTPEDLFEIDSPPELIALAGSLVNETIDFAMGTDNTGTLVLSGSADLEATVTWDETIGESGVLQRVEVEASLDEVLVTVDDAVNGTHEDVTIEVPAAKLAMAVNANLDIDPVYDGEGYVNQIDATYATSAIVRLAISVDTSDPSDADITGNFIATLQFGDSESISVTEAMTNDPQTLSDYLEQRIQPDILELEIKRYDNDGELLQTYTYSKVDLLNYFESFSG